MQTFESADASAFSAIRQSPICLPAGRTATPARRWLIGMRAQLHARNLVARAPPVVRSKRRSSLRQRPSYAAVTSPSAHSASIRSTLRRAVRVDDRELFRRTRRVQRWQDLPNDHTAENLLASPLRSPNESNYNSLMHTLYGSDFIYGSLVHKAIFRRRSRNDSADDGQTRHGPDDLSNQLLVKTCAFVHTSMFDKKNEQMCYAELFSPTSSGGFSIATCSLAGREVIVGKVRAPLRRAMHQLHPFSAWLSAEPASSGVHVVFRARFHRSESDGSCSPKVMNARLWKLAKGMCKLGKVTLKRSLARRSDPSGVLTRQRNQG
ncbi:hypothetical protein PF005_g28685 [Phytophthora fragariae]|uniref:Uncharacterized protein n=1 Tax=Phytophthora fragariae TaxID=53985 RepID=A0A6A3Q0H5_9STRA|nr:hypothetical protein PF009_g27710 [Phytophthora fragariae]KAE9066178.1 hypothetical protein PF007_g28572 [Phytophthora fragariae]KAE9078466.1 hypothetical protein PF006_g27716 [Phytophthora fragariae]KAE9167675.1 hypothetical protein PF005_g28685 [Phytophthora fragariae]